MNEVILAVDTTHEFGSLALLRGTELIEEVLLHAPGGFGQSLYWRLGELLERQGLKVEDVDCFAAASGPGSFTGVRMGLACVKGLAEAAGKPAVAISNLAALGNERPPSQQFFPVRSTLIVIVARTQAVASVRRCLRQKEFVAPFVEGFGTADQDFALLGTDGLNLE